MFSSAICIPYKTEISLDLSNYNVFFSQGITIKHLFEVVLITSIPVHWPFFPDTASSDHGPPSQAVDFHCLSLPAVVIKNINWRPSSVDITEEKIS